MLSSTDKEKLLKSLLIFACLLLAVGGLSLYHRKSSRTLADLEKEASSEVAGENESERESDAAGDGDDGDTKASGDGDDGEAEVSGEGDAKPENGTYPVKPADGFSYEPLGSEAYLSLDPALQESIPLEDLFLVRIKYVDFSGASGEGELLCHRSVAGAVTEIFYELYRNDYQLNSVTTAADFHMPYEELLSANKSFCLALETGDGSAGYHSRGLAVQLNPLYNPVVRLDPSSLQNQAQLEPGSLQNQAQLEPGSLQNQAQLEPGNLQYQVLPEEAGTYTNRAAEFPFKINADDLAYRLFTEHGFVWGGDRNASKAYGQFVYPDK